MLTFLKILEGCREGNAEAWRALAGEYTPLLTGMAVTYSPDPALVEDAWRKVLSSLADDEFARLKKVEAQSDREFLIILRGELLDRLACSVGNNSDAGDGDPAAGLEALSRLMKTFPLLHQNVAFLELCGYSETVIEQILRISPDLAKNSMDRLNAEFGARFRRPDEPTAWQALWLKITSRMRAGITGDCIPIRRLIRILDGQFGWYEKDPIENHLAQCLHCLEAWMGLNEIALWMRQAKPLAPQQVDDLVSILPLKTKSKDRRSLLKRAFR